VNKPQIFIFKNSNFEKGEKRECDSKLSMRLRKSCPICSGYL